MAEVLIQVRFEVAVTKSVDQSVILQSWIVSAVVIIFPLTGAAPGRCGTPSDGVAARGATLPGARASQPFPTLLRKHRIHRNSQQIIFYSKILFIKKCSAPCSSSGLEEEGARGGGERAAARGGGGGADGRGGRPAGGAAGRDPPDAGAESVCGRGDGERFTNTLCAWRLTGES